uniref:Tenascin-like protein n=1 Tax=Cacopsylla melanoneura TaxID=428564 RepID=A0A8D8UYU9_9HEMI
MLQELAASITSRKGGRLYPAYSLSGSDGEDSSAGSVGSPRPSARGHSTRRAGHKKYVSHTYQEPAGLSDTPTSDAASDATLTDSEVTSNARDSTLLVHNGFLLTAGTPPDVPPRNPPTMNRLNGRLPGGGSLHHPQHHLHDRGGDPEFEPSCLVRTPSGNVYIPADIPKNTLDYKSNSSGCSSPSKTDLHKNSDRCPMGFGAPVPVLPVRNNLRRPNSTHHFPPSRFQFQKGFTSKCSWKCTAIALIVLCLLLTAALSYITMANLVHWSYQSSATCSVLVDEDANELGSTSSQTNLVHRNQSISHRTKPNGGNSGGRSRFKRHVLDQQHASKVDDIGTPVESLHEFSHSVVGQEPTSFGDGLDPSEGHVTSSSNFSSGFGLNAPSSFASNLSLFLNNSNLSRSDSFVVKSSEIVSSNTTDNISSDTFVDNGNIVSMIEEDVKVISDSDGTINVEDILEITTTLYDENLVGNDERVNMDSEMTTVVYDLSPEEKSKMKEIQSDDPFPIFSQDLFDVDNGEFDTADDVMIKEIEKLEIREEKKEKEIETKKDREEEIKEIYDHDNLIKEIERKDNEEKEKKLLEQQTYLKEKETELLKKEKEIEEHKNKERETELLKKEMEKKKSEAIKMSEEDDGSLTLKERELLKKEREMREKAHNESSKILTLINTSNNTNTSNGYGSTNQKLGEHLGIQTLHSDRQEIPSYQIVNENEVTLNNIKLNNVQSSDSSHKPYIHLLKHEKVYLSKNKKKIPTPETSKHQNIIAGLSNDISKTNSNLVKANTIEDNIGVPNEGEGLHAIPNDKVSTNNTLIDLTHSINNNNRLFINVTISTDGMVSTTNQLGQSGVGTDQSGSNHPVYFLSLVLPTMDAMHSNAVSSQVQFNPLPKVEAPSISSNKDQFITNKDTISNENGLEYTQSGNRSSSKLAASTSFAMSDVAKGVLLSTTDRPTSMGYLYGGICQCECPNLDNDKDSVDGKDFADDWDEIVSTSVTSETSLASELTTVESSTLADMSSDDVTTATSSLANNRSVRVNSTISEGDKSTTMTSMTSTVDVWDEDSTSTTTEQPASNNSTGCPKFVPPPVLYLEVGSSGPARSFPPDGTTFKQIEFSQKLSHEIEGYGYLNLQFYQSQNSYVRFEYNIPRGSSIAVYIRRNALPTHTQYHILDILKGFKIRTTRASHNNNVKREMTHYLEPGHWFLSLYNDDGDAQEVTFSAILAPDMTQGCPAGCSNKGQCILGKCQCNSGFGGDDCSESVCPVLCSQRGDYINGECQCNPGWKGKECHLRHDECEVPDCHGHGHCVNGKCQCGRGYKGVHCEQVDCPHPTCNNHGYCMAGTCLCKKGWKGLDCGEMDKEALQCLPDCSGHGTFDLETQSCICQPLWSGGDCSSALCDKDCGAHGHCVGDACVCNTGWSGEYCNLQQCDPRCNEHGQCKNGTCLCVTGWNGKHCTLEGCPSSCSNHGQCRVNSDSQWECKCSDGWDGKDCSVLLEQNCNDGKDNDKDGLVDCEDPECCSNHNCRSSQLCVSAPKPIDILLRKQPPAITASFFERMKFLIEESSLQNYAKKDNFNESVFWSNFNTSRSAVVRGRVVTSMGMGLVGVRVSTSTPLEGFTLTRDDGWFDLLVNGGGAVTLQFGRSPFKPHTHIVHVPWNEVVIIDTITMQMGDDRPISTTQHACKDHDYDTMKPVVLATWKHGFQGACPDRSSILAESQVVQESFQIPGTGLNLVYHSSRSAGYLSTIQLQLTPAVIPDTLQLIYLRITIEGILFEKVFEADPMIKFTYAWNRLNVYRQRVYGVTTALVKVGYKYRDCRDVMWDLQTTKLSGHDMSISEIGGWNLDIHHRYNFHEGILQKGDGSNIYLKNKPRIIRTTLGDGHQRPLDCKDCNGEAGPKQRLLAPVALATAPDGSLFVGDFNLIRRIMTDGTVRTVVRLNVTRVAYRYHIAYSPLDGTLYISDPESHQILRVKNTMDFSAPDYNFEPAVGSGERCLPGDEAHCGDGAPARDAKLAYPKGVAVSADNILYFADGTNIRMVDRDGIVTTVIGNHMHKSHWKPIPCEGTLNIEEVHLRWPTDLAISPLDDSLHIVDDHLILQLTKDNRIKVVAGRPLHCPPRSSGYDDFAPLATLVMPQSIAFDPTGNLFIAESDSQRVNRVRVIGTDGKISHYAGAESKCNCLDRICDCFDENHYLAATSKFNTLSSIVVSPDGVLHIADQANYRIRSVLARLPEANSAREYEVYSPETQEVYVFNRFGQHIATKNILTGETSYTFQYNVNTSNGKLSMVVDSAGNRVFILRNYASQVESIENIKGQKCRLKMSKIKLLSEVSTQDNFNVTFDYHGTSGLLKSKLDSAGRSYVYNYDEFGRLTRAFTPTGKIVNLAFDLSTKGAMIKVINDDRQPQSMLIKGSSVVNKLGEAELHTSISNDGNILQVKPWGHSLSIESVPYPILQDIDVTLAENYPVPSKQKTEIGSDLANRFEWKYFLRRGPNPAKTSEKIVTLVGRKLRVNGENLLSVEYDRNTGTVGAFIDDHVQLLNISYDKLGQPIKWNSGNNVFASVELEYDKFGRLSVWRWGRLSERYAYDQAGRLTEIRYADDTATLYAFKDMFTSLPLKVTTPRGSDYLLQYDDAGALQSLTTPRGHIHTFSLQTSLGFFKYQYYSPMSRHPYELHYNDNGQILSKLYPHQSGRVAYVYDSAGKLDTVLAGLSSVHYTYQENTNLVKNIDIIEPNFELKHEFKYHFGILKDEKLKFGSKSGLHNVHMKYQYDGNARVNNIDISIDSKDLTPIKMKYNQNVGTLENVNDLRIYKNMFNRSVIQDQSKEYFAITEYDQHARIKSIIINIKSFDIYRLELEYDPRSRISQQKLLVGRNSFVDRMSYSADGHILEVTGNNNFKYVYDENGNTVAVLDQGHKLTLGYDIGDRVVEVGDVELNGYDARGFVVRRGETHLRYNEKGQMSHAAEPDKFSANYRYDDRGRLIALQSTRGNVTQLLYADPMRMDLVTHLHNPKTGRTFRYLYDEKEFLIAVETTEQRFYVASDQNGSPLALFDTNGNIIKEIRRTPFGKVILDSNPDFYLPIDFQKGIPDPYTGLVYINKRWYDPTVGQWMTPAWERLANELTAPTDVFIYRFHNNDPVNPQDSQVINYMTDLESWLQLYGFEVSKMLGAQYIERQVYQPSARVTSQQLAPDFGVMSGLQCIVEKTTSGFGHLSFVPQPLLKMEFRTRNLLPRVAYRRAVFGEGLLISRSPDGRALISTVEGVNQVMQDVVTSVFNNSHFLDVHFSHQDQDLFYFVKELPQKIRDDLDELKRLGSMFNITTHETATDGKELRLHNADAIVSIRYGADPQDERHRLLKHAHKRAVERAWEIEKSLIMNGLSGGRGDWTKEEREELNLRGRVEGYEGVDIHSVQRYPQLADDPGNVTFRKDASRKKRKRRNHHHGAGDAAS